MWRCSDPFLNYLEPLGYCVVRLPKADIQPLELLAARGRDLDRLGGFGTVLKVADPNLVPPVNADCPVANISGRRTGDLKASTGLGVLGSIVGAMGGSSLGLEATYRQARALSFEFIDVFEDRIEVVRLDQALAAAEVDPLSRHVATLLNADAMYVTTTTLKTRSICVFGKRSDGTSLQVSLPELQALVGARVGISLQSEQDSVVQYQGQIPLVFGFQAVRLFYDNGRYTAFEPASADMAIRGPRPAAQTATLLRRAPRLRLAKGW